MHAPPECISLCLHRETIERMDAPGVDDEAIAAQLHRELNAFTRRAARGDLPPLKPLR